MAKAPPKPVVEPSWEMIPGYCKARQFTFKVYDSLDDLLARLESRMKLEVEDMATVAVQVDPNPFSDEGANRWPFHARVMDLSSGTTTPMVVKQFKVPTPKGLDKERYLAQMEVQVVSALLAEEFNESTKNLQGARRVTFSRVTTLHVEGASGDPCKYYNLEKPLEGSWKKFSSNSGYVDQSDYACSLQAFTHWTYERSKGHLIVGDLQGVRLENPGSDEFWLSDPAIYSRDLSRFTETNMGESGFQLFYKTHRCNDVCRALKLNKVGLGLHGKRQ